MLKPPEMRSIFTFFLLFLAALVPWPAASQEKGAVDWFLAKDLRGFNLGFRSGATLTEDDFSVLAKSRAKVVRVMLRLTRCDGCVEYELDQSQLDYLDSAVAAGRRFGFRVILNFAPQPGGKRAEYWSDPRLRESLVSHWTRLAAKFAGDPTVIAYDLLNEPNPHGFFGREQGQREWREIFERLIVGIRKVDATKAIVVEPAPGALPSAFRGLEPLPFSGLVYSVHMYEPHELTHQGIGKFGDVMRYPTLAAPVGRLDIDALRRHLEPVRQFQRKHGVPVYVGEFSIVRWAPGDSAFRYVADLLSLFEEYGWTWTYHAFREAPAWDAELREGVPRGIRGPEARKQRRDTETWLLLKEVMSR